MRRRNSVFQFVLCSGIAGFGLMALALVANTLHLNIWSSNMLPVYNETSLQDIITAEEKFQRRMSGDIEIYCPNQTRIGSMGDGGWSTCLYGAYNIKKPCLVYSFGINNDWSFDDEAALQYGCNVRAFDPSMNVGYDQRHSIWFYKEGLGGSDAISPVNRWQVRTLQSFRTRFKEASVFIDYLKIDIEHDEWKSLETMLKDGSLSTVKQLGIEFHTRESSRTPSTREDYRLYNEVLDGLSRIGFKRWYSRTNRSGFFRSAYSHKKFPCCFEMVFLNTRFRNPDDIPLKAP